jgi:hypothetical protein
MNRNIFWVLLLFAMVFVGLQTAQPAAAVTKIDQFATYHMGGQHSDADVYKVYRYSKYHVYITDTYYDWNSKLHKYVKTGYSSWIDLRKISKKTLRIREPQIDYYPPLNTYKYTKHTATYYYWHKFRYMLKQGISWN